MSGFSSVQGLTCLTCGRRYPLGPMLEGCPDCRNAGRPASLDVTYEYDTHITSPLTGGLGRLWNYHTLLPIANARAVVTLGEGATPLVALPTIADEIGASSVWLKHEAMNPTHSFKDRANAVTTAAAAQFGFDKVLCTSTGNHGVSLAAYAARAGLRCLVLLSPGAPPAAVREIRYFGADVVTVPDGAVNPLMADLWRRYRWYVAQRNAPGTGGRITGNPFGLEGYKTMAYEIFHQLQETVPDEVFIPVAGGDGAWGLYKGFHELTRLGLAQAVPRIIACQSAAGAPLEPAWRLNLSHVEPVPTGRSDARSIVDRQSGEHALLAVRRSKGRALALGDSALRAAQENLRRAGLCVELSSAAPLAGLRVVHREGANARGLAIVVIATGAGLRWPATFDPVSKNEPPVADTAEALKDVISV
ncbi:MAG TPA: pyridoxal-phosphate dependent enzyme [bacterium]|nr:pyridoxal-phosphate dependent enzyme [bacterium]